MLLPDLNSSSLPPVPECRSEEEAAAALAEEVEVDTAAEEEVVGVEVIGAAGASVVAEGASAVGEEVEEGSGSRTTDPRSTWSVSHQRRTPLTD